MELKDNKELNLLEKATVFAMMKHEGQTRKGSLVPYIVHPIEVASVVQTMTKDENVIAAALLHDTLEDTETTYEELVYNFGEVIADLVRHETENKRAELPASETWEIRKSEQIEHIKNASLEVKMLALSDKLCNLRAIHSDYEKVSDIVWEKFNQKDKQKQRWYFSEISQATKELSEFDAYAEFGELIKKVFDK